MDKANDMLTDILEEEIRVPELVQLNTKDNEQSGRYKVLPTLVTDGISEAVESHSKSKLYSSDLVLVFPRRQGGEIKCPENFTRTQFINKMLGIKKVENAVDYKKKTIQQDPLREVFRTDRCFLNELGLPTIEASIDADSRLNKKVEYLEEEYAKFVGSAESTTEVMFCELIAIAVAKRIQLACGLTTNMFESCGGDAVSNLL